MSRERAIKNCVNCYELAKMIMLVKANEEIELKGNLSLITLYNNAMKATEGIPGEAGRRALQACEECNFTEPRIANELRKAKKG